MDQAGWKTYFESEAFAAANDWEGSLGAVPGPEDTRFALWAPTAQRVVLRLFRRGEGGRPYARHPLERGAKGVWTLCLSRDLDGVYYDYRVTVDGRTRTAVDPYAKAAGRNGGRGMVVRLDTTGPAGWEEDRPPAPPAENIIYEVHIKDFTYDPASGVAPQLRGKYLGFCQGGTTLNGDGVHPTGLDYLKRLGVTHVQLMPVYDFGSVEEGGSPEEYNWGYDPEHYNLPEGSYATDPAEGKNRIRELKTLIQTLHRAGLRVIMDVVYNHTYRLDSALFRAVPWYYVRQQEDGIPSNGSGCGCDLASERRMCARYILDSVLYWAEEYHMDGFRFDLMGLLDVPLMNEIRTQLDRRYGPGEKLVYGEPWAAGPTACRPGTLLADKGHLALLAPGIGAFCDNTRDAIKGSVMVAEHPGFVNGGGLDPERLAACLRGWSGQGMPSPERTVNYISAHDDWTLWDKLVLTLDPELAFDRDNERVFRANRLAAAIHFCCQGHLFFLSGEEFGRTKRGVKNSYASPAELNRLDWALAWSRQGLVDYYRGLIALRKRCPGLRDKSEAAGGRWGPLHLAGPDCAAVSLDNRGDGDWNQLFLVFNCGTAAAEVPLPQGSWQLLADGEDSFLWQRREERSGQVTVPPCAALLLGKP